MKAILIQQFGDADQLILDDWPTPSLKGEEVLVKVEATALNRADILQREGKYPPPKGVTPILGLEFAGHIVKMEENIDSFNLGDRVCGLLAGGGYAEYVAIHKDLLFPIPDEFSYEQATAIPEAFLTAYQSMFELGKLKSGEKVLIHAGGSGVGTAAIQLAKLNGGEIFITASSGKHDLCLELGATHAIDYKTQRFEDEILKLTSKRGVDLVVDFIGAPYFKRNINVLGRDGRLIMLAFMGGMKIDEVNLAKIIGHRLSIIGSTLRSRSLKYKIELLQAFKLRFWESFQNGELRPIIDSVFDWQNVIEAHQYMEANKNVGKIVLRIT